MRSKFAAALITNLLVLGFSVETFGQDERSHTPLSLCLTTQSKSARQTGRATDLKSLMRKLREAGATASAAGKISQPFFSVSGRALTVNGDQVQVFEYRSNARAKTDAAKVSADGTPIGTTMITWVGPPHFYRNGRLIVLYIGGNSGVLKALEKTLGPQFAGR